MRMKNMLLKNIKASIMILESAGCIYCWIVILSVGNVLVYVVADFADCTGLIKRLYVLEVFLMFIGECS